MSRSRKTHGHADNSVDEDGGNSGNVPTPGAGGMSDIALILESLEKARRAEMEASERRRREEQEEFERRRREEEEVNERRRKEERELQEQRWREERDIMQSNFTKLLQQVEANEQEAREQREAKEEELRRERKEEQKRKAIPKLTPMTNDSDLIEYLENFQEHMAKKKVSKEDWSGHLMPLLNDNCRTAAARLEAGERGDYDTLKEELISTRKVELRLSCSIRF